MKTVFDKIDSQKRSLLGFNPMFALQNISMWRKYFLVCVIVTGSCWVFFGFDSSWSMLKPYIDYVTSIFIKNPIGEIAIGIPFKELRGQAQFYYGVGNHFSAPVIYGLSFIYLSRYLEDIGIEKSLNFCSSTGLSLMNIGIFEWSWNLCYSQLQNQPWTIMFRWKQASNLTMFTLFIVIGVFILVYLYSVGYQPRVDTTTIFFAGVAISLWLLWIFYPFPIGNLEVSTTAGVWTNTRMFPQTYYAVDVNPLDKIAIGVPHFVENNSIHVLNVLAKIFTTLAILWFSLVRINFPMYWDYHLSELTEEEDDLTHDKS